MIFFISRPRSRADQGANHPAVGKQVEILELQPLTGDPPPISAADLRGKVTVINYWGPWCGFCVVEFPHLVELEDHFVQNPDFQFLSVSCSPDGDDLNLAESTAQFQAQHRASFPTWRDAEMVSRMHLASLVGEEQIGYPTTVVIGRDSKILGLWSGYLEGEERDLRQLVEQALSKS